MSPRTVSLGLPLALVWVLTWSPLALLVALLGLLVGLYLGTHPGDAWRGLDRAARWTYRTFLATAYRRHYTMIGLLLLAVGIASQQSAWLTSHAPRAAAASAPVAPRVLPIVATSAPLAAPAALSPSVRAALVNGGVAASEATAVLAITRAWQAYGEPYAGDATLLVQVAHGFGIDPALPAALYLHEDGNLNNRALFPAHLNVLLAHDRNPGNIRCMYSPCFDGYQVYPSYRAGIVDWFRLFDYYRYTLGISSLAQFIATYCPPTAAGNGPTAVYENDVLVKMAEIKQGW